MTEASTATKGSARPSLKRSFHQYIFRTLKSLHPDMGAGKQTMNALDAFARIVLTNISDKARFMVGNIDTRTITVRDVSNAVSVSLPPGMVAKALELGNAAVEKFDGSKAEGKESKPIMRETRAGIYFSVSLVEKFLRSHGTSNLHVSSATPVFLAAVVEHLVSLVVTRAAIHTHNDKRVRITIRHVVLAVGDDDDLTSLFSGMNIFLVGGGVVPAIEQSIIDSRSKKKRKPRQNNGGESAAKPHRFRPGTVALRQVKAIQKMSTLQMQKLPFSKQVRAIASSFTDENLNIRFTEDAMLLMQEFVEKEIVDLFRKANKFAIHAGRETVNVSDYSLFSQLYEAMPLSDTVVETDDKASLTDPGIQRLGRRGGVIRISVPFYNCVRQFVKEFLTFHIRNIITVVTHSRRQTVSVKSIQDGLHLSGINVAVVHHKIKRRNKAETDMEKVEEPEPTPKKSKSSKSSKSSKKPKSSKSSKKVKF